MRRLATIAMVVMLGASSCTSSDDPAVSGSPGGRGPAMELAASLRAFGACDELLDYVHRAALPRVGPWGVEGLSGPFLLMGRAVGGAEMAVDAMAVGDEGAGVAAPAPAAERQAGVDFSETNVQEAGVDEPDIVKTDGSRIVAIAQGRLHVVDVDSREHRGSAVLPEGWRHELFIADDRAFVLSQGEAGTVLTEVALAGDVPAVTATLTVEGEYVTARLIDDTVRVVVRSHPTNLGFVMPDDGTTERAATLQNRRAIVESEPGDWVPSYRLEERSGGGPEVTTGPAVECDAVHHTEAPAGLGMVTVVTIDIAGPMQLGPSAGVLADAQTVYASMTGLYVATNRWLQPGEIRSLAGDTVDVDVDVAPGSEVVVDPLPIDPLPIDESWTTELHKFDISQPDAVEYRGSGSVLGHLLNQWSLSEHNGFLRVATTDGSPWGRGGSESFVTVFEERGGALVQIGQVGELGPDERIYAVRFMGDVGYVVTFRETDPLYTVDLSDPTAPRVLGELKIMGYSAYLHPLADGFLLGVGQDATETGQRLGTQLSVFDVRDLANPTRVHQLTLSGGDSEAEYDHRAFLYWPVTGLTVLPLSQWEWDEEQGQRAFVGAAGFRVDPVAGIADLGRLSHPGGELAHHHDREWTPEVEREYQQFELARIRRSLVVGDTLFTLSEGGLLASGLDDLSPRSWLELR